MIIKNGNRRSMIILSGCLHMTNYSPMLTSVFAQEYGELKELEFIDVGIKMSDGNRYIQRENKEMWDIPSFNKLIKDLMDRLKEDEEKKQNKYEKVMITDGEDGKQYKVVV